MTRKRIALALGGVLVTTALATLNPVAAFAAPSSTVAFSTMSGAPGDTVTITITPGANGLTDFCANSVYDNTYANTDPGFTVTVLVPVSGAASTPTLDIPSGSSSETFTPSTQTSPLTITRTIPSDVPDGTYSLSVTCISPSVNGYDWTTPFDVPGFVVSRTAPPTDPSSESGNSGNSGVSGGSLPDTGEDAGASAWTLSLAAALVTLGAGLMVWRRRVA